MTANVVALLEHESSGNDILAALYRTDPQLRFAPLGGGVALAVLAPDGTVVLTIESARRIRIPGEAVRLLGVSDEPVPPYWWIEFYCPAGRDGSRRVAAEIAGDLVAHFGGRISG